MIIFNPETGLEAEETSVVRENIRQKWVNAFATDPNLPPLDTSPETPAGQLIDGETALASQKDNDIVFLANQFDPRNAVGVFQDALASIYFLERKVAVPTFVTCQAFGAYGTVIPYGALVQDANGYTYTNTAVATINANGMATIYVRCTETGAVEVPAGTLNKIITTVPGWDSVTNAASGVTGRAEETQAAFESRRAASVAKNAHGSVAALFGTLAELKNVSAVLVLENVTSTPTVLNGVTVSGHSVYISIYGGDNTDIARAIYNKLDAGCGTNGDTLVTYNPASDNAEDQPDALYRYYIKRPTATETAIKVTVEDAQATALTDAIKQAVVNNFNGLTSCRRIKMGDTVYSSRFYADVIKAGVNKLVSVEIKYPAATGIYGDSATVPADEIPTISADDVTVVYA